MFRRIHAAVLRRAAIRHLAALGRGDLVVYDRGYYSLALLQAHNKRRVEAVFHLKRNASRQVCDFVAAGSCDEVVTLGPAKAAPLRLPLVKYAVHETPYVLGTKLLDAELYPLADLAALYHGRWSVEELYKSRRNCCSSRASTLAASRRSSRSSSRTSR